MKAIQVIEPENMQIIEVEKPQINKEKNVLIKMKAAGICGSDRGILHGHNAAATYPRIIGHEIVGVVEAVGENVTKVKPGDRVIIDQVTNCGHCYACRKGRPNVCVNLRVKGVHIDGGYREWLACNEKDCYILPDFLEDKDCVIFDSARFFLLSEALPLLRSRRAWRPPTGVHGRRSRRRSRR